MQALRALGRSAEAVDALRRLLWLAPPGAADALDRQRWRALLIRLYLDLGEIEDARLSLQRYRQDYGDGDADSRRLAAEVLLRADGAAEAFELIGDATDTESAALRLLAGLRSGRLAAGEVAREARALAGNGKTDPELVPLYWDTLVQARAGEPDEVLVDAMERALVPRARRSPFATVDGDRLWQAWLALGRALGNRQHLAHARQRDVVAGACTGGGSTVPTAPHVATSSPPPGGRPAPTRRHDDGPGRRRSSSAAAPGHLDGARNRPGVGPSSGVRGRAGRPRRPARRDRSLDDLGCGGPSAALHRWPDLGHLG